MGVGVGVGVAVGFGVGVGVAVGFVVGEGDAWVWVATDEVAWFAELAVAVGLGLTAFCEPSHPAIETTSMAMIKIPKTALACFMLSHLQSSICCGV